MNPSKSIFFRERPKIKKINILYMEANFAPIVPEEKLKKILRITLRAAVKTSTRWRTP